MRTQNHLRKLTALLCCLMLWQQPAMSQNAPKGDAKRALRLAEQGAKAEAAGRLEDALADYHEAVLLVPRNVQIVALEAALRSRMIRGRVATAEERAIEGDLKRAADELAEALRIDPGNTIVAERLRQMEAMKSDEEEAVRVEKTDSGIPELKPQPGRHSFNLRGDTRTAYEQVALAFGVKATFDADLTSRNV